MTNRFLRNLIVLAVILAVAVPFALQLRPRTQRNQINYSAFIELVQAERVADAEIDDGKVDGRLKSGQQFTTYVPSGDASYLEMLKSKGVLITVMPPARSLPSGSLLLYTLLPVLLVGLWVVLKRRVQSGQDLALWLWQRFAREQRLIAPPSLSAPRGFSHGILVKGGQLLFIAGQVASDVQGNIVAPGDLIKQFEQVLRNLNAVVEAAGGTLQDVVKLNVFVRDRRNYVASLKPIGEVFRRHFNGHYPAIALVEVSGLFQDDALIEMEGIAVLEHPRTEAPAASGGR